MASSKNPQTAIPVPTEVIELSKKHPEILCNLRPTQRPENTGETKKEKQIREIRDSLSDGWFFYHPLEAFLKGVKPDERLVLVCQGFGEEIFTFTTDVENIYWAGDCYPRIDFERRPELVRKIFGESNLWGGFILAVARVSKKVEISAGKGYEPLIQIAKAGDSFLSAESVGNAREKKSLVVIAHVFKSDGSPGVFPKFMVIKVAEGEEEKMVKSELPPGIELASFEVLKSEDFEEREVKELIRDIALFVGNPERTANHAKDSKTMLKFASFIYQLALNRGAEQGIGWAVKTGK